VTSEPRPRSYSEFWPHYLRAHALRGNRALHHAGTLLALLALATAVIGRDWRIALAAPLLGYGLAWAGHFGVEGNRPATFGHPAWSLWSDLRMLGLLLTGRLGAHLRRHVGG
jgi:hypothetical protein